MIYADTNFLMACHFAVPGRTDQVERFLRRGRETIAVGELAELEAENRFARECGTPDGPEWQRLQARLDSGSWQRVPLRWSPTATRAREILRRFSARANLGTTDVLHLAAAQEAGCTTFASFDSASNARALALALRMRLFPEASEPDLERLAKLRR